MSFGRARIASAFLLALLSALILPGSARARELRPPDAPRLVIEPIVVPPLPLEYHTQDRAGIRLSYHPSTGERVRSLEATVVALRAELSAQLGVAVLRTVEIRVAAEPVEMARLAPTPRLGGNAFAFAFRDARLVVLSAAASRSLDAPDLEGLLRHALAHLALDEALGDHAIPPWFHEGYAAHVAAEDTVSRARTLTAAALQRRLISVREIEQSFPEGAPEGSIAEAEAADFARFLVEHPGRDRFAALVAGIRGGATFEAALGEAYGAGGDPVELAWRKELGRRYGFVPVLAGATLGWAVVAVAIYFRRLDRRRALAAAPKPRAPGERRARPARESRPRPARLDDEALAEP
ncbi:MAG: hypothetical protein ABI193_00815, partial [Minicystis sp.]